MLRFSVCASTQADESTQSPDDYQLTLYAIPAPRSLLNEAGISWKNPGGLLRRTIVNEAGGAIAAP